MGKKNYSGGGTLLNSEAGFTTYDPAEEQKRNYISSEPAYTPVRPSFEYTLQVQQQLIIILRHVRDGRTPHIPMIFKKEISEFGSLIEWARSKPEYEELLKEQCSTSKKSLPKKSSKKQKSIAKESKVGRIAPTKKPLCSQNSKVAEGQKYLLAQQLEELASLLEELKEERKRPWHSDRKKEAITERYHSIRKKYDLLRKELS